MGTNAIACEVTPVEDYRRLIVTLIQICELPKEFPSRIHVLRWHLKYHECIRLATKDTNAYHLPIRRLERVNRAKSLLAR